jgi:hypothetical protein
MSFGSVLSLLERDRRRSRSLEVLWKERKIGRW